MEDLERKIGEAAQKYSRIFFHLRGLDNAWVAGAKSPEAKEYWQQGMYSKVEHLAAIDAEINEGKRIQQKLMYSEEEVKRLIDKAIYHFSTAFDENKRDIWFEQNKKK